MKFSPEIELLGKYLKGSDSDYKLNELLQGIKNERIRLGKNLFLVTVDQSEFDIDGQTDYLYLIESFTNEYDAINFSNTLYKEILKKNSGWDLLLENCAPDLSISGPTTFDVVYKKTFKVSSGVYDRKYTTIKVIKSDGGFIVGLPLFESFNSKYDLWSYFVGVGESTNGKSNRPEPS